LSLVVTKLASGSINCYSEVDVFKNCQMVDGLSNEMGFKFILFINLTGWL